MEWEKPQLVDLNMVKYEGQCVVGDTYKKLPDYPLPVCSPTGSAAEAACNFGSAGVMGR